MRATSAMTAADAFLAAILAEPGDDALRLIFADWLDDQGQSEHAEFIRVQCKVAILPPCDAECRNRIDYICQGCQARRRERELFQTYRLVPDIWLAGLPVTDFDWGLCNWRRGFLELIRCTCAAWLLHGPAIVRQQPVTRVELSDRKPFHHPPSHRRYYWDMKREYGSTTTTSALPPEIHQLLPGAPPGLRWVDWPTEVAALDALSAACLALARKEPAPCR